MPKYGVYITLSEVRYIEVTAKNEQEAEDIASENMDDAAPCGDEGYDYEVEEL